MIAFWRVTDPNGEFCQWYQSDIKITRSIIENLPQQIKDLKLYSERYDVLEMLAGQYIFTSAEQFMMMGKAALFGDKTIFAKMSITDQPSQHKILGRKVAGFEDDVWEKYCKDIVIIGNYLKFIQNDRLFKIMKNTNDKILVEGSPYDRIWGVGLQYDSIHIGNKEKWRGKNYLGESLMFVRNLLQ